MSTAVAPAMVTPEAGEKTVGVFISHKSDDKEAAVQISTKLTEWGAGRLDVHVSELLPVGEKWDPEIHRQLQESEWLLLLYTGTGVQWDWCLYETGFFAGVHGADTRRLVCLHRKGVELPGPLQAWESVTEEDCDRLLTRIYREPLSAGINAINPRITDKTLKELSEFIMQSVTEKPQPTVLTPYLELALERRHQQELEASRTLSGDIRVTSRQAGEIFGVLDSGGQRGLYWADIAAGLAETRQKSWIRSISDSLRHISGSKRQSVSTTFPIVYSVSGETRRRWRPILYSVQFGGTAQVFRIVFSEILREDDPRPTNPQLDLCTALVAMARMIRFGVIDVYRPMVDGLLMRKRHGGTVGDQEFDDKFGSLPAALDRIETEAMNSGLTGLDCVLDVLAEREGEQSKNLEAWTAQWLESRKQLCDAVAARHLEGVQTALKGIRDVNRVSFDLFARRYCELIEELR